MRDDTISKSLNDATHGPDKKCNVFDRLPPFQYRYMPSGKMYIRPEDKLSKRTSVDDGGVCHMGRAANLPVKNQRTEFKTRNCRTVSKNSMHVVARYLLIFPCQLIFVHC